MTLPSLKSTWVYALIFALSLMSGFCSPTSLAVRPETGKERVKPAEEKPVEEKAAAEKPVEEKSAEEKPAEEKPAEATPVPKPNVVLIVVDTLRADRLTQYGYELKTSTPLDEFVGQATLFERTYSTSSWTIPATATIHTGQHPGRHRTFDHSDTLKPRLHTIAERLHGAGYRTAGFSHNVNISKKTKYNQGFDTFEAYRGSINAYPHIIEMIEASTGWLDRYLEEKKPSPFFLYLHSMNCHGPYRVPESHLSVLFSRPPKTDFPYYGPLMRKILSRHALDHRKQVTPALQKSLEEQYATAVRYSMDNLATLFDNLRKRGLWDNSLVIVTSDHGEEFFDHGGFSHAYTLYNEVIQVPLIIKLPHQESPKRTAVRTSTMDIYPTILDVTGIPGKQQSDGLSLAPFLGDAPNGKTEEHEQAFNDRKLHYHLDWKNRAVTAALQDDRFKYIYVAQDYERKGIKRLLFDMIADPQEQNNLYNAEPERAKEMHRMLNVQFRNYKRISKAPAPKRTIDETELKALKALGYIQ